jgi:hypothetical protein
MVRSGRAAVAIYGPLGGTPDLSEIAGRLAA